MGNICSSVWEEPGRWQLQGPHLSHRWVTAGDICHYLSGRQEGYIRQKCGILVCLVKVGASRKDMAWLYEGMGLESSGRKGGNKKGSNGRKEKEKVLVDRKMALAGKVEGLYSRKEQEKLNKECVGTDLCVVITWVDLGLWVAELHTLWFLCMCQLYTETVSEVTSIERFSMEVTVQQSMSPGIALIWQTRIELRCQNSA